MISPSFLRPDWRSLTRLAAILVAFAVPPAHAAFTLSTTPSPNPGLPRQWAPGDSVTLSVGSVPAPVGVYQWLHDEQPIAGATATSLTLTNLSSAANGNYRLRVTSGAKVDFSDDTITLNVLPFPVGAVDPTFISALPANSNVRAIGPFAADGSTIVSVATADGLYQASRLDRTGNIVTPFNLSPTARAVSAGFADGSLIFPDAPYLRDADGREIAFSLPAAFDPTKPLTAAAVRSDGKFYLAQGRTLARFFPDGRLDPAFVFSDSTETGIDGLVLDRNNRLYVQGRVTDTISGHYPTNWSSFYRVTDTGTRDPGFQNQIPEPILSGSLQVTPLDDGRILYYSAYHGYRLWKILRDDGTSDPSWDSATVFSERPIVVNRATSQLYLTDTSYKLHRYTVTSTGLTEDTQFFSGTTPLSNGYLSLDPAGKLLIHGQFAQWEDHATNSIVRLLPDAVPGVLPPNATAYPTDLTPSRGDTFTVKSTVLGTGPFTYQWLALDGQPLPADTTSPQLVIPNFSAAHLGRYQLRVTGPGGISVLSNVTAAVIDPIAPFLANLSGRALSGEGEDTIIAGLTTKVSAGALGVSTLIRGAGPALRPLGVTNFLPNPALDLYNASGQLIANNDQWCVTPEAQTAVTAAASAAGAFSFAAASNDAALLRSFYTGNATVMMKSQDGGTGVGLLEIYQLFPTDYEYQYQSLLNLSFRARTGPGEDTAIAGFVIVDPQNFARPAKVLLRAVGPTLATQGIQHPLADPVLTVYNSKGEVVAQNDNWPSHLTAEYTAYDSATDKVGAFHLLEASKDAGLLLDLPAGAYSMHATGGTGVVLLEIYLVR